MYRALCFAIFIKLENKQHVPDVSKSRAMAETAASGQVSNS